MFCTKKCSHLRLQLYLCVLNCSYPLRIECMSLYEETTSVLEMLKPKAELLDAACDCEYNEPAHKQHILAIYSGW